MHLGIKCTRASSAKCTAGDAKLYIASFTLVSSAPDLYKRFTSAPDIQCNTSAHFATSAGELYPRSFHQCFVLHHLYTNSAGELYKSTAHFCKESLPEPKLGSLTSLSASRGRKMPKKNSAPECTREGSKHPAGHATPNTWLAPPTPEKVLKSPLQSPNPSHPTPRVA